MQQIICKINQCPFRSGSGFCLNRLVVINENGVCNWITKHNINQRVYDWQKSTWKETIEKTEKTQLLEETKEGEEDDESGNL